MILKEYIPRFSFQIRKKLYEKRKARKRWQTTRSPVDKTILNKLTSELQKLLRTERNRRLESEMQNIDATKSTEYSLWKINKKLISNQN